MFDSPVCWGIGLILVVEGNPTLYKCRPVQDDQLHSRQLSVLTYRCCLVWLDSCIIMRLLNLSLVDHVRWLVYRVASAGPRKSKPLVHVRSYQNRLPWREDFLCEFKLWPEFNLGIDIIAESFLKIGQDESAVQCFILSKIGMFRRRQRSFRDAQIRL